MTKQPDDTRPQMLRSMPSADMTMGIAERRLTLDAQHELMREVEQLGQQWCDDVSELRKRDRDFAVHLCESRNMQQTLTLCGAWMADRLSALMTTQHRFVELWLDLSLAQASRGATSRADTAAGERSSAGPQTPEH